MQPEPWAQFEPAADHLPAGWWRHAKASHVELFTRWVGTAHGRWLKTDLYEEVTPARTLLGDLPGTASWVGIDVSAAIAGRMRRLSTVPAVVGDVRCLPFRAATFDGVLSTSTLDHFASTDEIASSLAEIHRVLRPGGLLIVTFDNAENPMIRLRNRLPRRVQRASGLVPFAVGTTVSEAEGVVLLGRCGFEVTDVRHLLHAPHVVGTRLARWRWFEDRALPAIDRAAGRESATGLRRRTGHYVAFRAGRGG